MFSALLLLLFAVHPAHAQSPMLTLQATPSPFGSGATIAISASVERNGWYECPYEVPPQVGCVTLGVYASAEVTGSNGFSQFVDDWDEDVALQTSDPGPGQTLQATTYTLSGTVVVTYCVWDVFEGECYWPPEDYVEYGQTQVTVLPGPALSGLSPGTGVAGTLVTLTGARFTGTLGTVTFNGMGGSILQWTDTSIGVVVPTGATSGPVVVTAGGLASNSMPFTVVTPPSLSSLTPGTGPVGQSVTISGSAFGSSQGGSTVTFSGATGPVTASVSQWSATSITATVPGAAMTGLVQVTVAGQTSNGLPFTVSPGSGGSCTFTDNPLQAGVTVIKAVHVTELRTCIAGMRSQASLPAVTWTDGALTPQQTAMKAVHVTQMRTALAEVFLAWELPAPTFTDTLTAGTTPIRAVHLQELRVAIQSLQAGGGELGPEVISYYHADALGSVRLVTNASQQVIATRDYLPFGQDWQHTGVEDARGFALLERTPETGNETWLPADYAGARYYHNQTGRFLSPDDPIYIDPLNPQTWNLYAYVMNNPLSWVDPSGHQAESFYVDDFVWNAGEYWANVRSEFERAQRLADQREMQDAFFAAATSFWDNVLRPVLMPETPAEYAISFGVQAVAAVVTGGGTVAAAAGARAALSAAARWGTRGGVTRLYRAVRPSELADIARRGAFWNPPGNEVKYFSTSAKGAASYARLAHRAFGDGPYTIVETAIPSRLITSQMRTIVDRGIQTVVLPTESLGSLAAPRIMTFSPLP